MVTHQREEAYVSVPKAPTTKAGYLPHHHPQFLDYDIHPHWAMKWRESYTGCTTALEGSISCQTFCSTNGDTRAVCSSLPSPLPFYTLPFYMFQCHYRAAYTFKRLTTCLQLLLSAALYKFISFHISLLHLQKNSNKNSTVLNKNGNRYTCAVTT